MNAQVIYVDKNTEQKILLLLEDASHYEAAEVLRQVREFIAKPGFDIGVIVGPLPIVVESRKRGIKIKFNPRDIWVGVYWDYTIGLGLDVYVCILPCFPIKISF